MIRNLQIEDYDKKYFSLLSQLTSANILSKEKFQNIFNQIKDNVFVIEEDGKIVASGTLLIEQKFIHDGGLVAHMEDIVVDQDYRKKGYGYQIISFLINVAKEMGCYKIIADCHETLLNFYSKNGFHSHGHQIALYF